MNSTKMSKLDHEMFGGEQSEDEDEKKGKKGREKGIFHEL